MLHQLRHVVALFVATLVFINMNLPKLGAKVIATGLRPVVSTQRAIASTIFFFMLQAQTVADQAKKSKQHVVAEAHDKKDEPFEERLDTVTDSSDSPFVESMPDALDMGHQPPIDESLDKELDYPDEPLDKKVTADEANPAFEATFWAQVEHSLLAEHQATQSRRKKASKRRLD